MSSPVPKPVTSDSFEHQREALERIFVNADRAPCPGAECCGGSFYAAPPLLEQLLVLHGALGRPLVLRYLYKCVAFNRSIGGGNDFHAQGLAADIDTIRTGVAPRHLAQLAWDRGFNAVGVYGTNTEPGYKNKRGMVHLGIEPTRRFWGDWFPASAGGR